MPEDNEQVLENMPENNDTENIEPGDVSSDESGKPQDDKDKSSLKINFFHRIYGLFKSKKKLILYGVGGLCLFLSIGTIYLKWGGINGFLDKKTVDHHDKFTDSNKVKIQINQREGDNKKVNVQGNTPEDQKNKLLSFNSFIIPLKEQEKTYISLSISFDVQDKTLRQIMTERSSWIRGLIYDILREEVNINKEIPLLESLKIAIVEGIIAALPDIKIDKVYITQFLAM
jgi:flagellar basal body-associated protein FliL